MPTVLHKAPTQRYRPQTPEDALQDSLLFGHIFTAWACTGRAMPIPVRSVPITHCVTGLPGPCPQISIRCDIVTHAAFLTQTHTAGFHAGAVCNCAFIRIHIHVHAHVILGMQARMHARSVQHISSGVQPKLGPSPGLWWDVQSSGSHLRGYLSRSGLRIGCGLESGGDLIFWTFSQHFITPIFKLPIDHCTRLQHGQRCQSALGVHARQ